MEIVVDHHVFKLNLPVEGLSKVQVADCVDQASQDFPQLLFVELVLPGFSPLSQLLLE